MPCGWKAKRQTYTPPLRRYEARLKADLESDPLDLIILGIGDDGHICSLFPGHPGLAVSDRLVMAIDDSPKPPPSRITLTMPFVLASARVWVVAVGANKAPVLQQRSRSSRLRRRSISSCGRRSG